MPMSPEEEKELRKENANLREALDAAHNMLRQRRDADSTFVVDQPDGELRHG